MPTARDAPPTPPTLGGTQREDLHRLWETQIRQSLDVPTPSDAAASSSSASKSAASKNKNNDPSQPTLNDKLTLQHITRLHDFFVAVLQHHSTQNENQSSNQSSNRQNANGDEETAPSTRNHSKSPHAQFLKDPRQSCLDHYVKLFVETITIPIPSQESSTNTDELNNNQTSTTTKIRLRGGRRVISLDYNEFMEEVNQFEFRGDANMEVLRAQSFGAYLYHFPIQALPAVNVSMALAVASLWRSQQTIQQDSTSTRTINRRLDRFLDHCQVVTRFQHATPLLPMADVKTGLVRKFISVKGNVVKARPKRLRVCSADFSCQKCAAIVTFAFEQGRFALPTKCSNPTCKSRTFTLIRPTARYVNVQELRLQESQEESTSHAGRTPRQLQVLLTHDLIDSCRPGDIIMLACYVDAVNSAVAAGRAGKRAQETSTYKLFLQGHSITTLSETTTSKSNQSKAIYTQQQLQNITQLCHADHRCLTLIERRAFPFDLLVRSLCPAIIGHHAVKAGILLCLLGGTPPTNQQERGSTIRSNSHILIVGDPGMGKSQMLNAATQLAARSVYVGGNTATTTGLTVSLTKEEGGETGIEAGALVLADQGVACIDELDKCKHLDGLLEAMEQQQVSIAKAGIVASLPARCSVIGAANPKHGSYNMSKSVAENLNMARPILSRFDLVFILRDRADKNQDQLVASNIMNLYRRQAGGNASQNNAAQLTNQVLNGDDDSPDQQTQSQNPERDKRVPLEKRLAWVSSFNEALPAGLVRDYIAYAREYCKPKLTQEAAEILKKYYMDLRYPSDGKKRSDTVPITTRQLEALIRLSQARAKACLREFVLKEDALDVVELLKKSVEQVHTDEYGVLDRTRAGAGGQSNRKMRKKFTEEIYNLIGVGAECTLDDLRRVADRVQCSLSEFQTMVDDMRLNGVLMKNSHGQYKVLS